MDPQTLGRHQRLLEAALEQPEVSARAAQAGRAVVEESQTAQARKKSWLF